MRYFAQLDSDSIVLQVIVLGENKDLDWLSKHLTGTWVETFEDARQRKNYAGIGFNYDEQRDAFIPPKPYDSWVLDEETCLWNPPVDYPQDGLNYRWDESVVNWVEVQGE